ncbi:MAG: hypothetical protein K2L16_03975 [Muribaculaceae bacterium]|nr:hypothetical protein [Muribaculaceae bacterium]
MKSILRTILLVVLCAGVAFGAAAQNAARKKVAVYMTGSDVDKAYKRVLGSKLVGALTESGEYAAVERTAEFLEALESETDYQTSGEVRDSQIARLGQRYGVRYVVVADVTELFDEYFVAARMINVETGLVERTYDASGPAESMAQLVALSQSVANGLIGRSGRQASASASTPKHLALCATDGNGRTVYITAAEWENMTDGQKIGYTKKGICLLENGEGFLVMMRDVPGGYMDWYAACRNNAPTKWQAEIIVKNKDSLNDALRFFGGVPFESTWYWTNESYISSRAWDVDMGNGYVSNYFKTNTYRVRAVAPVPVSSAM